MDYNMVTSSQETIVSSEEDAIGDGTSYTKKDNTLNIFVIDSCSEMGESYYGVDENGGNKPRSKLHWAKKAIEMFLLTKSSLNSKHEYAISLLQGKGYFWYQEFTRDIKLLLETLADVEAGDESLDTISLDDALNHISSNCILPSDEVKVIPEYVFRIIFIYGRSKCQLDWSDQGKKLLKKMQMSPYFFFDALYLPCEDTMKEKSVETINWLCEIDLKDNCYVFEASKSPARLFECMAKLLAHPLQRSSQTDICNDL